MSDEDHESHYDDVPRSDAGGDYETKQQERMQQQLILMSDENMALKDKLHQVSSALEQAANKHRQRTQRPSSAERKLREANKRLKNYRRENEQLQKKSDSSILGDRIKQLENALSEKISTVQQLVGENKTLRKIQHDQEKALLADDESKRFERDYRHVSSENKKLKDTLSELRARLKQLERQSDAKFKKINELQVTAARSRLLPRPLPAPRRASSPLCAPPPQSCAHC